MIRSLGIALLLASLGGCVVAPPPHPAAAHWVAGYYGPNGYWHAGHWVGGPGGPPPESVAEPGGYRPGRAWVPGNYDAYGNWHPGFWRPV